MPQTHAAAPTNTRTTRRQPLPLLPHSQLTTLCFALVLTPAPAAHSPKKEEIGTPMRGRRERANHRGAGRRREGKSEG